MATTNHGSNDGTVENVGMSGSRNEIAANRLHQVAKIEQAIERLTASRAPLSEPQENLLSKLHRHRRELLGLPEAPTSDDDRPFVFML